jgi:septal ring factor EnvC (AmiA/AmiB activator)
MTNTHDEALSEIITLRADLAAERAAHLATRQELSRALAERDEARAEVAKHDQRFVEIYDELKSARADAARLRAVLERVREAMLSTGQAPDGDDDPRRPLATAVWDALDGRAGRDTRVGMAGLRDEP